MRIMIERGRLHSALFALIFVTACTEQPTGFRGLMCGTTQRFCPPATECILATRAADCDALLMHATEVATPAFEVCTRRCPIVHPCPDFPSEASLDCNCYSDCVDAEPEASRRAQLDLLECETPPECR